MKYSYYLLFLFLFSCKKDVTTEVVITPIENTVIKKDTINVFMGYKIDSNAKHLGVDYWKNIPVLSDLISIYFHEISPGRDHIGTGLNTVCGDFNNDGYTNVEKYINSLFPVIVTGVAEIKQNSKISVSPNPIVDQAIITIQSGEMITNWKIYDLSGQLVSVSENQPGSKNELQRGNLRSGMYILKIYTKAGIAGSLKIVMN